MKATLSIIDENGNRYHGNVELLPAGTLSQAEENQRVTAETNDSIAFDLPIRAFVRKYAAGNSGGAAKLTVLLAFLAKGIANTDVSAETLRVEWGRLTAHLGTFNRAHATRAKDRAWVDSASQGTYRLGPLWREAFN